MAVLVYTESENGSFKKSAFEVASYGKALADQTGQKLVAVTFNQEDGSALSSYGVDHVVNVTGGFSETFSAKKFAAAIAQVASEKEANLVVISSSANSKYLAPLLAVKLTAAYTSNVVALPSSTEPLTLKRSCYTSKAFSTVTLNQPINIIGLSSNAFGIIETQSTPEQTSMTTDEASSSMVVSSVEKVTGTITIADADIVVSGGRGLKGPENWHLVEELASILGAATACSKPVSDMGWRPHSEHVGQTGKPVASNLYIAIGVSGAIQHLAGINSCKVKVVINIDPEAPFFKAADYGIVGDAFDVLPKLIEKLKTFKAA
ncbi:MAG: electron transfer flavoprotein alpha subunit [Candidatus Arcticimaribacter sp.]|jgi:electron transfer flavoprotein alpha subunit|tara:strand:+ start:282 stop:1238 length:957 start_codon:yes stop_codon:yes gene_type:complete